MSEKNPNTIAFGFAEEDRKLMREFISSASKLAQALAGGKTAAPKDSAKPKTDKTPKKPAAQTDEDPADDFDDTGDGDESADGDDAADDFDDAGDESSDGDDADDDGETGQAAPDRNDVHAAMRELAKVTNKANAMKVLADIGKVDGLAKLKEANFAKVITAMVKAAKTAKAKGGK